MSLYSAFARPLLFRFDPERIHRATMNACGIAGSLTPLASAMKRTFDYSASSLRTSLAGLSLESPIGLGAGMDKNGSAVRALAALGFGAIEVGSISLHPSAGNPGRRRVSRLLADEALLVNYGVPNEGVDAVVRRLAATSRPVPLGVSLVETNTGRFVDVDAVIDELTEAAERLVGVADYIAVNLHCPNSGDGANHFGDIGNLTRLLDRYRQVAGLPPVFLKIFSSLPPSRIDAILEAVTPFAGVEGFILNALAAKPYRDLRTPDTLLASTPGSLTGRPLRGVALAAVRAWYARIDPSRFKLIGAGGVTTGRDAYELLRAGASLVQIVTGLVYEGPGIVRRIKAELAEILVREGVRSVDDIVGVDGTDRG